MKWTACCLIALSSLPSIAKASPAPWHDGLTLSPVPGVDTQPLSVQSSDFLLPDPATPSASPSVSDQPLSMGVDPAQFRKSSTSGGFTFEPAYASGDRIEYRTRAGIGLGVATNAAWSISQSVRLARGLDLSIYYLHGISERGGNPVDEFEQASQPTIPERGAGFHLEWKF